MHRWSLVVHEEGKLNWSRCVSITARNLERAVQQAKDLYLMWPFGDVQENVGGDEATFIWHEKGLIAELRVVEDD